MDIDEEESRAFKEFSSGWDEAFIEDERNRLKEIVERRQRDADKCEPHLLAACLDALDRAKADLAGNDKNHPLTNNTSSKSDEMPSTVATGKPPGKMPNVAVGKLAIKAAWQIECESKRVATAKAVIALLQEWADAGSVPETLICSDKPKHGVKWRTSKGAEKPYDVEACGKALKSWLKSRA
jgi:hypothetical protein